ncbi:glutaredoxin-2, mitochondrial isoform X1 [Hydra vulgaris]|uniref:Glutaredoxin-2, mitochondrial n=2 Tax=Hydra vulgaris TaxID=6087 RepID=A0ABM4CJQ5_HYDVU|nr:glutaredoxin-2, mitochondrial-like [Hydra vulgaris]ASX98599.1 glutaredoxin 1 [Hydra vulgaris]
MGRAEAEIFVKEQIDSNFIVVFSKTYCPYCTMAKKALDDVNATYTVLELENRDDCQDIQDVLMDMTGARTVPRVFINRKFIGGGTDLKMLQENGELKELVKS